jgi:hypothetical protein
LFEAYMRSEVTGRALPTNFAIKVICYGYVSASFGGHSSPRGGRSVQASATRLPNFQFSGFVIPLGLTFARPELLGDTRLVLIGTIVARRAPPAVHQEWRLGVDLPGRRIDGQGDEHDLFHGKSTKSGMTAPHARVTPAWFFCGQSAVRSDSQSVSR